jgi:hypothetical protein
MAILILHRLDCEQQQEYGSDSFELRAAAPKPQSIWKGDMQTGRKVSLRGRTVNFVDRVSFSLIEKDYTGDDVIGSLTIYTQDSSQRGASRSFNELFTNQRKGGRYRLWYTVRAEKLDPPQPITEPLEPETKPRGNGKPATSKKTLAKAGGLSGKAGAGKGKVPCKLGSLIVTVVNDKGDPINGAMVSLSNGAHQPTRGQGKCSFDCLPDGSYGVQAVKKDHVPAPAKVTVRVKAGPPTRVTVVLGKFKIMKVTPDKDCRWYVNMDQDEKHHHGRHAVVRAHLEPKVAGVSVDFTLSSVPEPERRRRNNTRARLTERTALTDEKGVAKTLLKLSTQGGENFSVGASLAGDSNKSKWTANIFVWRRLYYEITEMRRQPGPGPRYRLPQRAEDILKQAYRDVSIEMRPLGRQRDRKEGAFDRDAFLHSKWSSPLSELDKWGDKHRSPHQIPWKVHFAVTSMYAVRNKKTLECVVPYTDHVIPNYVFEPWGLNTNEWLISADYRLLGSKEEYQRLPEGAVQLVPAGKHWRLKVRMNRRVRAHAFLDRYEFRLSHYIRHLSILGWQRGHNIFIFMRNLERCWGRNHLADALGRVCVHEVGHALDLLSGSMTWSHPRRKVHSRSRDCVMWCEVGHNSPLTFLGGNNRDNCRSYVLGKDLSRSAMQGDTNWR